MKNLLTKLQAEELGVQTTKVMQIPTADHITISVYLSTGSCVMDVCIWDWKTECTKGLGGNWNRHCKLYKELRIPYDELTTASILVAKALRDG